MKLLSEPKYLPSFTDAPDVALKVYRCDPGEAPADVAAQLGGKIVPRADRSGVWERKDLIAAIVSDAGDLPVVSCP